MKAAVNNLLLKMSLRQRLLAREMLKRGIKLYFLSNTNAMIATYGEHKQHLIGAYTEAIPYNIGLILSNKFFVRGVLNVNGFSIAKGKLFSPDQQHEALIYAKELGFPVLLRQENAQLAMRAVKVNSQIQFKEAFRSIEELHQGILIEDLCRGSSHRIFITKHGYWNVLRRIYPSIVGYGKKTLEELIFKENLERLRQKESYLHLINISTATLGKKRLSIIDSIPAGKRVFITDARSANDGAKYKDVTSKVHPLVYKLAKKVLSSFPKAGYIAFELLTTNIHKPLLKKNYVISEVYPSAGINIHFPMRKGNIKKDAVKVIVDQLFPETAHG